MEYRIVLSRMEFRALHGCYELERKVGNRFTVDLELRQSWATPPCRTTCARRSIT